MARQFPQAVLAAALLLALAPCALATISFPGVRFPGSPSDKHQVLSAQTAVVGRPILLKSNNAQAVGGYQVRRSRTCRWWSVG